MLYKFRNSLMVMFPINCDRINDNLQMCLNAHFIHHRSPVVLTWLFVCCELLLRIFNVYHFDYK